MENQKTNPILEAFEAGKRIRRKEWGAEEWCKSLGHNTITYNFQRKESITKEMIIAYCNDFEILPDAIEPEEPKNPIVEAYKQGKRIREKNWEVNKWIKTYNDSFAIYNDKTCGLKDSFTFWTHPEQWEIWYEDIEPEEPQPDAIQQAINLLKANGYEIYKIIKTKL